MDRTTRSLLESRVELIRKVTGLPAVKWTYDAAKDRNVCPDGAIYLQSWNPGDGRRYKLSQIVEGSTGSHGERGFAHVERWYTASEMRAFLDGVLAGLESTPALASVGQKIA